MQYLLCEGLQYRQLGHEFLVYSSLSRETLVVHANAFDVIQWYHNQIFIKLMRAITSKLEEVEEEPDDYPKDSDDSAKVALIGIDRSIAAWGKLQYHFPEKEDEILDILVHLTRLRKTVEIEYPEARTFLRPGFDT